MKKYLVVLAAAVFALASCGGGGSKYTSLKFKESQIALAQGSSTKLQVLYEPTSLEAPACVWASSNPDVAKVDQNGNVEALEIGTANITATHGEGESALQAVCQIEVKSEMDMIEWAGWSLWNFDDETILTDTFEVKLGDGNMYKCVMIPANAFVWDQNIMPTYDLEGYMDGLTGMGYVLEITDMPIYMIVEGSHKGSPVGTSYIQLVDPAKFNPNDTAFAYCAAAGKLGDAQKFYTYLTDTAAHIEYSECLTGTELSYVDWDSSRGAYWFGLGGEGFFYGDEESVYYQQYVNWFEYRYGLAVVETEEGLDFKQPAEWGKIIEKYYENMPAQGVNKDLKPIKPIKRERPFMLNKRANNMDSKMFSHK